MFAVVMAGGLGIRLWPASRIRCPKQFLPLFGRHGPLEETLLRLVELCPPERIMVVANAAHRDLVTATLAPGMRVVYEPVGRGTAPCLGLALLHLPPEAAGDIVVALPADNWIEPGAGFGQAVAAAVGLASEHGLVTIGTTPSWPATGFGYIRPGDRLSEPGRGPGAFALDGFVEKPAAAQATVLFAEGWLWHAGIFAYRPPVLKAEIERLLPELAETLGRVREAMDSACYDAVLAEAWAGLPVISADEGLMARGPRRAAVVHADYSWSDLGTWDAVRQAALAEGAGNAVSGDAQLWNSRDCLVRAEGGRFVALLGVEGLTVVDTPDALLILGAGHGQEVRRIAAFLSANGRRELL